MRRASLLLLGVVASTGCLFGEVTGIPCTADDECATAHFCDLSVGSCRAELDGVSAPRLEVAGVAVAGGAPAGDAPIAASGATALELVLENAGGFGAVDIEVTLAAPPCLRLDLEGSVPDGVVPGGSARVAFTATADGTCSDPLDVGWELLFSGRSAAGTFTLTLE